MELDNKYKKDETVFAKEQATIPLIIKRYVNGVYYCKIVDDPENTALVYYERELMPSPQKS
ncbi:MAG: hypothetical protein ACJAVN_000873 [Roseivirga sp.]|jgi:hypothetical protein